MVIQVQPLKVLVTRQVVKNRMDYFTYLNGTAKDELDDLDWIIGKFRIMTSKVTIEAHHNDTISESINASIDQSQWPSEDWENFKECFGNTLPKGLVKFIEGTGQFTITDSKDGLRTWLLYDADGWKKTLLAKDRDGLRLNAVEAPYLQVNPIQPNPQESGWWGHFDDIIEDGWLVRTKKGYEAKNGKMILGYESRDSMTIDIQGNGILRNIMWSLPNKDIKVTMVMWAMRLFDQSFSERCQQRYERYERMMLEAQKM